MKTGSWYTTKTAPGRVGISTTAARGMPAGFRMHKALAPERAWMNAPRAEYEPLYVAKLAALNPQSVVDALETLAAGAEPVLLCYEVPPFTEAKWCHRRIVAKWLERTLGLRVDEYGYEGPDLPLTPEGQAAFDAAFPPR